MNILFEYYNNNYKQYTTLNNEQQRVYLYKIYINFRSQAQFDFDDQSTIDELSNKSLNHTKHSILIQQLIHHISLEMLLIYS